MQGIKVKTMLNDEDGKTYLCIMIPMQELLISIAGRYNLGEFGNMIKNFIANMGGR